MVKDNFVEITDKYFRENKQRKTLEEEMSYFYKIEQMPIVEKAMGFQNIAFRESQKK